MMFRSGVIYLKGYIAMEENNNEVGSCRARHRYDRYWSDQLGSGRTRFERVGADIAREDKVWNDRPSSERTNSEAPFNDAWVYYFWSCLAVHERQFFPANTSIKRRVRKGTSSHRAPKTRRNAPRNWSYTERCEFDYQETRLLVFWALKWLRGNRLPLDYRDSYAAETGDWYPVAPSDWVRV